MHVYVPLRTASVTIAATIYATIFPFSRADFVIFLTFFSLSPRKSRFQNLRNSKIPNDNITLVFLRRWTYRTGKSWYHDATVAHLQSFSHTNGLSLTPLDHNNIILVCVFKCFHVQRPIISHRCTSGWLAGCDKESKKFGPDSASIVYFSLLHYVTVKKLLGWEYTFLEVFSTLNSNPSFIFR